MLNSSIRLGFAISQGILIFALASGAIMFALTKANSYRHNLDALGSEIVTLMRDVKNAASFAEQTTRIWSAATRDELRTAARGHAERLQAEIDVLGDALAAVKPKFSKEVAAEIDGASINGDLLWTARDIVRNLGVLAKRAEHGRMEPARNPQPERSVRAADADPGAHGDRNRAPSRRGL